MVSSIFFKTTCLMRPMSDVARADDRFPSKGRIRLTGSFWNCAVKYNKYLFNKLINLSFKKKQYSATKRNKIGSFVETWMDLETVIQSEVSQKNKYRILIHIRGS